MKTKITLTALLMLITFGINRLVAQDLVPGINYSYNPPGSNGIITGITVDVCNNDNSSASSFSVAIYLYNPNDGNYWILDQTNVSSLSGNSCITISNWDININNTPNIPAYNGYRIGTWVDSNEEITESDENNNAGLMAGSFSYSPSSSGINDVSVAELLQASPNPSSGITKFSFNLAKSSDVHLDIYNASGQLVKSVVREQLAEGQHSYAVDCSVLNAGVYYYTLTAGGTGSTKKFVVLN
jgi:hypothetical protein